MSTIFRQSVQAAACALAVFCMASTAAAFAADNHGAAEAEARADADMAAEANGAVAAGETCIPLSAIRSTRVQSNSVIDFVMPGGEVYRNTLPNRCPGLKFEESFSYSTSLSQLCSADIIRVLETGAGGIRPASACGLGRFVKLDENAGPAARDGKTTN